MERSIFVLGHFLDLAKELGRGGLVEAACLGKSALTDALEQAQNACGDDVGRIFRRVKRHLHVTLCSKVVHLVGSYLIEYLDDAQRIAQIGIVEMKVRMAFEMSDALAEVHR